jgi:hypothetical protein
MIEYSMVRAEAHEFTAPAGQSAQRSCAGRMQISRARPSIRFVLSLWQRPSDPWVPVALDSRPRATAGHHQYRKYEMPHESPREDDE